MLVGLIACPTYNIIIFKIATLDLEGVYVRPAMKFQPTIKEILFTLLLIAGKIKWKIF